MLINDHIQKKIVIWLVGCTEKSGQITKNVIFKFQVFFISPS